MAKWLYPYKDDLPKGLFKITAEDCKKSTSGWRAHFCVRSSVVIRGETSSGVANSSVFSDLSVQEKKADCITSINQAILIL